jgi:predicted HTH transcriptional regulator
MEVHADTSFQPIILTYFKQNPLEEQDRQTISMALNISYVAAQEHLCNLLTKGKLAKTLNYKYVLPEMKETIENLSFTPVKKNYEPRKYTEDSDFLSLNVISAFKALNAPATAERLAHHIGISKWDIEISLMNLINSGKVTPISGPGHSQYILKDGV